jgi:uncharacterized membrane protein
VFALVLFVAVLHVVWNAVLKSSGDPLRTAVRANIVGVLAFAPAVLVGWLAVGRPGIPPEALGLGAVSGFLEAAYFAFLAAAYKRGDLSVVYPIARGTAPLLSVVVGVVVLGERLGTEGALGVAALLVGILLVQRPWRAIDLVRRRFGPGIGGTPRGGRIIDSVGAAEFALLTGVTITAYSAVDRVAARLVEPWLYGAIIFPICAVALTAYVRLVADRGLVPGAAHPDEAHPDEARPDGVLQGPARPDALRPVPATWRRAGAAGIISLGAYGLILFAYTLAPLSAIAPLRESAVVIASAWGAIRLREAVTATDRARRIGGAVLVLIGAVLIALEG